MTKKLFFVLMILALIFTVVPQQDAHAYKKDFTPASTFNHWLYANLNLGVTPEWSLHVMPGHCYEYTYEKNDAADRHPIGTFLTELFIGPWYSMKLTDALSFKVGFEYYFMGFSASYDTDAVDWYNHCLEIIPIFSYKVDDNWSVSSRTIFHNVLYTSDKESVDGDEGHDGWGMLIRELITINYSLNSLITLSLGNEFFIGVVEQKYLTTTGRYTRGLHENRLIPGITLKNLAPGLSVTTNYIWRTSLYNGSAKGSAIFENGDITLNRHYIQLIVTYNYNLY